MILQDKFQFIVQLKRPHWGTYYKAKNLPAGAPRKLIFVVFMANTKYVLHLVLAIIILYLISFGLAFVVDVDIDTDNNVGKVAVSFFFIPIFSKKVNIKRFINRQRAQQQDEEQEQEQDEKSNGSGAFKRFLIGCAIKIAKAICVRNAFLHAKVGTGDAAADGMAVGLFRIMYAQFCAFFGFDGNATIEPEYDNEILFVDFFGIFSISFADIIFAVMCVVVEKIGRRGQRRVYANAAE